MVSPLSRHRFFTIGHSNHELVEFVRLLRRADVTAVADVRSQPYSQRYPQFNRSELESQLREQDIGYAFFGDSLGGRPRQPSMYDEQRRVDYERVRRSATFQQGLARLAQASEEYTVTLLCAEEDPLDCHRGLMIAPALVEHGIAPAHLRGDGSIESTEEMEARLLALTGVGRGIMDGLFANTITAEDRRELLAAAYREQAQRKAYRLRQDEAPDE